MQKLFAERLIKAKKKRRQSSALRALVQTLACVVIFCTTYALILPAITMEKPPCELEEHTHDDSCYVNQGGVLSCSYETLGVHSHGADCFGADGSLVCGKADFVLHYHDASCTDAEGTLVCTLPVLGEHEHTDECYQAAEDTQEKAGEDKANAEETQEGHTHGEDCYTRERGELICTLSEAEGHSHAGDCYVQGGLICELSESEGHKHGEGCSVSVQTCAITDETHVHDAACFEMQLSCTTPESEGHAHGAACYEQQLVCTLTEAEGHSHDDACYEKLEKLICELQEVPAVTEPSEGGDAGDEQPAEPELICTVQVIRLHTHGVDCTGGGCTETEVTRHIHGEGCFEVPADEALSCTLPEGHSHGEGCYNADAALICTLPEGHSHSKYCYGAWELICQKPEHTHDPVCLNDPEADVETEAEWMASFAHVAMSGEWPKDVVAIAESQLGYTESTRNYEIAEDGESLNGYTRYGAWYGDTYGDWCAMFASFCIHYAGVEDMPLESGCRRWIPALEEKGLYHLPEGYTPRMGELVFIDWDVDGLSDHVGIVAEFIPATDSSEALIRTVEGNVYNAVIEQYYTLGNAMIMGYGSLPSQGPVYLCGMEEHSHDESCFDAEGNAVCTREEHTHGVACTLPEDISEEDREKIIKAVELIEAMPSCDEIMETVDAFYEAEDTEGEEAYLMRVYPQVEKAYRAYMALSEEHRAYVPNADKLMELEFIWSRITLEERNDYYIPGTAENVTIHLFDYGPAINSPIAGQGFLPFYRLFPEYGYSVDGDADWDFHDTGSSHYGMTDRFPPVLELKMGSNGWPMMNRGSDLSWITSGGSLQYLFDPSYVAGTYLGKDYYLQNLYNNTAFSNPYTNDSEPGGNALWFRRAYLPVDNDGEGTGLFLRDPETGYWYYDSKRNAAWYDPAISKFRLYDYTVIPGHESYHSGCGNFLPFNLGHEEGIIDYQTEDELCFTDGIVNTDNVVSIKPNQYIPDNFRLETTDRSNTVNLNFGMYLEFDFYMPKDGLIDGEPMKFEFSGDDDVWIFIDDVLVLDIGGCHDAQYASINFADGSLVQPGHAAGYYKGGYIKTMFDAAGVTPPGGLSGNTFSNFSTHRLKMFYMERGGNISSCSIRFNVPQIPKNTLNVTKALEPDQDVSLLGNPDYYFSVLGFNPSSGITDRLFIGPTSNGMPSVTGITTYKVKNADGSYVVDEDGKIKVFTVEEYGIFRIKAGQTAVFEGIPENAGNFYVQEMIKEADKAQYPSFTVNHGNPQWNNWISWKNRAYYPGTGDIGPEGVRWYGVSSQTASASANASFVFEHQNRVTAANLAELQITKQLTPYSSETADMLYRINVEMGGKPLPVGTSYTVGYSVRTVGIDENGNSFVELRGGETAVLSNILSGSEFRVWEAEKSAKGHTVVYSNNSSSGNGENISVSTSGITGTVRVSDTVSLSVSNTQHGTTLDIPVYKSFYSFAGGPYTYSFRMAEMLKNGDSYTEGSDSRTVSQSFASAGPHSFNIASLTFLKHEFESLPAKLYYMLEETGEADPTADNTTQFLIEITVAEQGSGISASISNILQRSSSQGAWEDKGAARVEFINTLTGGLTVTKTIKGTTIEEPTTAFGFTLSLGAGSSGTNPGSFTAVKTDKNGNRIRETVSGTSYSFTLKHNESISFTGLPIGTVWTVREDESPGYSQHWQLNGVSVSEASGSITLGEAVADCTNITGYELPQTGGIGTHAYTAAGLCLMAAGLTLLLIRRKRRNKA